MDKLVAASAVVGGRLGLVVAGFLICSLFGALALWLGGKILGIPGATGRASIKASLLIVVVTFTLPTMMSILPVVGTAFGGVLSRVLSVVVVQPVLFGVSQT